jgi:hypothetical protein
MNGKMAYQVFSSPLEKVGRIICAPNFPSIIKTITNQLDAHVIIVDNAQAEINVFKVKTFQFNNILPLHQNMASMT